MKQIDDLLCNEWIRECGGPWGSIIVLAAKPHQEQVTHIDDFVWRMCVSYRGLNAVTLPFAYPIPRCDDAIMIFNVGGEKVYLITVDAKQGYHQVAVKPSDVEKLAFFAPNDKKYAFTVMPFGPTNAPAFYTCMMQELRDQWDSLFYETLRNTERLQSGSVTVSHTNDVKIDGKKEYTGSKGIIDDIVIWSTNLDAALTYFECVCQVFQQYRVSFRLDKCEFLKDRVEYVGHDLTAEGSCPAKSKFDMIRDWPVPQTAQALHSFIGLINFYHNYAPYFEIRLKPLRKLYRQHMKSTIPVMAWSPMLLELFNDMKQCITSSPILIRYDPTRPVFLKTDWSAEGMGWILMQPAADDESRKASKTLQETGECRFDLSKNGARLRPVQFGSRACTTAERKFHSFVGEAACGRWAIAQNKRYLWGAHFYWLCDCSATKEILEYSGEVAMIQRWSQELLGYSFTVVHRPARMMADVDALSRRYSRDIAQHEGIACILRNADRQFRPSAYEPDVFSTTSGRSIKPTTPAHNDAAQVPILSVNGITASNLKPDTAVDMDLQAPATTFYISSRPLTLTTHIPNAIMTPATDTISRASEVAETLVVRCLVIDDVAGSFLSWSRHECHGCLSWEVRHMFSEKPLTPIFAALFPDEVTETLPLHQSSTLLTNTQEEDIHIVDICFIPDTNGCIFDWVSEIVRMHQADIACKQTLCFIRAWAHIQYVPPSVRSTIAEIITKGLKGNWSFSIHTYRLNDFGMRLDGSRCCIELFPLQHSCDFTPTKISPTHTLDEFGFHCYVDERLNTPLHNCSIMIPNPTQGPPASAICSARIVGRIGCNIQNTAAPASCLILDSAYPGLEPAPDHENQVFGRRFGIAFETDDGLWFARRTSTIELLRMYSFDMSMIQNPAILFALDECVDVLLPHCIPHTFRNRIHSSEEGNITKVTDAFVLAADPHVNSAPCLLVNAETAPPCTLDWTSAYYADEDTEAIISHLATHKPNDWSADTLARVNKSYHPFLKQGQIQTVHGKVVLFKPIQMNTKYVGLVVVPHDMRRKLFDHYHAGPSGGHMGVYKTLYRLRARFYWPRMREEVKEWVRSCAHCVAYNVWRDRRSELYFSWPVTTPFWIMHLDLWAPGEITNDKGEKGYLLNALCDLTQFVVSIVTFDVSSNNLGKLFMEHVFLSFGCCAVVVVDDGSNFKGEFAEMCKILKLTLWTLSRGNHKGNGAERYHRFLNKTQAIVGNDRGTHSTFVQNAKTSQYAWNSAPIDGTDVTRSMAALGREFRFPLDIEMLPKPPMNDSNQSQLQAYLRDVAHEGNFATAVVQILVEERRLAHNQRNNAKASKAPGPQFKVGDVVKAHVQVNSQAKDGKVKKLSYRARGPFQITKDLGHNSYEVQRYDQPQSATRQYKGSQLYFLPPALFPAEPLDTVDQRFLNYEHAPVQHPLKQSMQIEMYNTKYFRPRKLKTNSNQVNQPSVRIDETAMQPHSLPTVQEMDKELNTVTPVPESEEYISVDPDAAALLRKIQRSHDKLFFIKFTPAGTMRPKWYLIQVDLEATNEVNPKYEENGIYYCGFLAKHCNDNGKSDEFARWWPDWYEYTTCTETEDIIFGDRVLLPPHRTPDGDKYVQWAEELKLSDDAHFLHGPFNFEKISVANRTRSKVGGKDWRKCYDLCLTLNILPPTTGSQTANIPNPKNDRSKKRKNVQENRKETRARK